MAQGNGLGPPAALTGFVCWQSKLALSVSMLLLLLVDKGLVASMS
jgi:hypothetical protein